MQHFKINLTGDFYLSCLSGKGRRITDGRGCIEPNLCPIRERQLILPTPWGNERVIENAGWLFRREVISQLSVAGFRNSGRSFLGKRPVSCAVQGDFFTIGKG